MSPLSVTGKLVSQNNWQIRRQGGEGDFKVENRNEQNNDNESKGASDNYVFLGMGFSPYNIVP